MLYPEPAPAAAAHESNVLELERSVDPEDADLSWLTTVPLDQVAFVESLAEEIGLEHVTPTPAEGPDVIRPDSPLEAVPLPRWLKVRLMRVFLRDVHHYLYDTEFSPRAGESYRLRRDVRARALDVLQAGARRPGPHMVVGHSLGSVIAYDLLTAVEETPRVDALLTVGSPLGMSEVQERLAPPWTRQDGWPSDRLGSGPWGNVFDLLDPVCGGLDRRIAGDYRCNRETRVTDIAVSNEGSWRHSISKYLGQERLRERLREVFEGLT
jgi:pimeloyl-ACP methyl ester carboxylesterase